MRALIILGMLVAATPMLAAELDFYSDYLCLEDHETVRYRVDLEFGSDEEMSIDIFVEGIDAPPRVRVLDSNRKERKERVDTSGDWELDFRFHAKDNHDTYYIEIDSDWPWEWSEFVIELSVHASDDNVGSDASIDFDRFFFDFESNDDSDHYDCAARSGAPNPWWLVLPAGAALAAYVRRRRTA